MRLVTVIALAVLLAVPVASADVNVFFCAPGVDCVVERTIIGGDIHCEWGADLRPVPPRAQVPPGHGCTINV